LVFPIFSSKYVQRISKKIDFPLEFQIFQIIYVDMNMAQILKYACIFQWQNSMRAHDE